MSAPGLLRTVPSAAALSASTGVTAQDKVDRLEARTAFRAPEPGAQLAAAVAAVAAVSDAQQAAVLVPMAAATSDAQQAAVVTPAAVAMKLRVRPLVASVEPAEMPVRLWFPARLASVLGQEES